MASGNDQQKKLDNAIDLFFNQFGYAPFFDGLDANQRVVELDITYSSVVSCKCHC